MFSWGGGGRQCLVLRGTRVPPSCKWEGTETGILLAQTGMRIPVWARRILPSWGRSCLVQIHCFTVRFIIKNITKHHPAVDPCWSSEDPPQLTLQCTVLVVNWRHIINYGCDLTLLNNNDNEARILSTPWSNQNWTDLMCVEFCNFFQEVITADSSAGSFSQ